MIMDGEPTGVLLVQTDDAQGIRVRDALTARPELTVLDEVTTTRAALDAAARLRPAPGRFRRGSGG